MPIPLLLFSDLRYAASIEGSPPVVIDADQSPPQQGEGCGYPFWARAGRSQDALGGPP
jgi:hypothetical protein